MCFTISLLIPVFYATDSISYKIVVIELYFSSSAGLFFSCSSLKERFYSSFSCDSSVTLSSLAILSSSEIQPLCKVLSWVLSHFDCKDELLKYEVHTIGFQTFCTGMEIVVDS